MSRRNGGGPRFMPPGGRRPAARTASRRGAVAPGELQDSLPAEAITLTIDALSDEGRGIGRRDGKAVFVTDALPGEQVQVQIQRRSRRYDEAVLHEVKLTSPHRVEPKCDHYGSCGGCTLQHLSYPAQLDHKQALLQRLLEPWDAGTQWAAPLSGSPWDYRHRARLLLADGAAGFRARASHRRIALQECPVLAPPLAALLPNLQQCLADLPGLKGELLLACDDRGRCAAQFNMERGTRRARARLAAWAGNANVSWAEGGSPELPSGDPQAALVTSRTGRALRFGPADFIQSNLSLNQRLVEQALAWLAPRAGEAVADWFCGLGNFTLPMAGTGARLTGFEVADALLARARANASDAGLAVEFRRADLLAESVGDANAGLADFDAGLLDPPRAGAAALCERLAEACEPSRLRRLLYVSCDPRTLARDLRILSVGGWRLRRAGLIDMFPQTSHIESMALLTRG